MTNERGFYFFRKKGIVGWGGCRQKIKKIGGGFHTPTSPTNKKICFSQHIRIFLDYKRKELNTSHSTDWVGVRSTRCRGRSPNQLLRNRTLMLARVCSLTSKPTCGARCGIRGLLAEFRRRRGLDAYDGFCFGA